MTREPASNTTLSPATALSASLIDDQIAESFKQSYVNETYLKDDSVKTRSEDGIVTLTGTVVDASHKVLAEDTAAKLPGVVRVDNKLSTKAEVATESADTWMARKVKLALLFHRNVSGFGTTVAVKDGIVTLTGEASSVAQKELTTEYAGDIEGVKTVDNWMTVAAEPKPPVRTAGERLDDASVSAQVTLALLAHCSTSPAKVKVTTLDGKVTLTGIAKSAAEKALVSRLISDIQGVSSVGNDMTVGWGPADDMPAGVSGHRLAMPPTKRRKHTAEEPCRSSQSSF